MKTSLRSFAALFTLVASLAAISAVHAGPGIQQWQKASVPAVAKAAAPAKTPATPPGAQCAAATSCAKQCGS